MKKSTAFLITLTAAFVGVGWLTIRSIGIAFLVAAAVTATVALINAKKGSDSNGN